jgi:hypothetical protein
MGDMTSATVPSMQTLAARWTRLGAMFGAPPEATTPDPERLLLDTAIAAPANSRLFTMAVSWLAQFGDLVLVDRLARLIRDELEPQARPTMGLLLETTDAARGDRLFEPAARECGGAIDDGPLFDVYRGNEVLMNLARSRANALSRKWGRWMEDFDVKADAIRPREWVVQFNPGLLNRENT